MEDLISYELALRPHMLDIYDEFLTDYRQVDHDFVHGFDFTFNDVEFLMKHFKSKNTIDNFASAQNVSLTFQEMLYGIEDFKEFVGKEPFN